VKIYIVRYHLTTSSALGVLMFSTVSERRCRWSSVFQWRYRTIQGVCWEGTCCFLQGYL